MRIRALFLAPSTNGLGHCPFTAVMLGSNPAGVINNNIVQRENEWAYSKASIVTEEAIRLVILCTKPIFDGSNPSVVIKGP